jgi:hypothetical protein
LGYLWHDEEGHSGTFLPYVLKDLPVNLWGRDVLQEMGAILYSPSFTYDVTTGF